MSTAEESHDPAREAVERFVNRFGLTPVLREDYRFLACHIALPLVLTPDLVHYLRHHFLPRSPPIAVADLLLSELCRPVGYELFAMDSDVRALLVAQMKNTPELGPHRMQEVAHLLIRHVGQMEESGYLTRQEVRTQQWSAMAFLTDRRADAARGIAEAFQSAEGDEGEMARLAALTQELAPQLEEFPDLIEYAKAVARARDEGSTGEVLRTVDVMGISLSVPSPPILTEPGGDDDVGVLASNGILPRTDERNDMYKVVDGTLTWLHLSDLHAGERSDWDAGRVLKSLFEDLQVLRDEHELRPDLLVFTGDAAFAGRPEEFDTAGRFLEDIREACEVERENVFLVPGNHDVDRSVIDPGDTAWLDERHKGFDVAAVHKMLRQGDADERWRRVMARLAAYRDFLERAGYEYLLADPERLTYVCRRRVRGLDVAVAGLNSAWSCHGDDRGRLWLGGHYQLTTLEPELDGADVRIGLVHHPLGWLGDAETGLGRDVERLFDVHLHGHEHEAWVTPLADGHVRIAAGTCYDGSYRESGYNVVRLDFENDKGEVILRRYENTAGSWLRREVPGKTDAQGVWHIDVRRVFELPPAVDAPVLSSEVLVDEVFEALRHNPLVILLAQDERPDGDVLRGIRERARRDSSVLHVTPPPHPQATLEQYFARLGRQCSFTEEIHSAKDWEDVLYQRLGDGEKFFVLVSNFEKGSEDGRKQLGTILRSLSEMYREQLRVVFSGGERLGALKYEKGEQHSVLSSAERRDWPEVTVDDVLYWQQRDYPEIVLSRRDAADVRTLCGAHPRWIRYCLEQRRRGVDERQVLVHYDAIDQIFIPYRTDSDARRRICSWLTHDDLGVWEAWISDELLRRLYWKNALREEDGRIVWRSEVVRSVGRRVLGCGKD